ncbi:hypothetical protein C823_004485 [Eubacterium plexicaudatum ASF492]|uniref:Uncharacterized protein n=1 Tax=Eubacterium plexicaudatum ASF492 TaxID=1235802 RepID=N1ZXE0_9FIRM|nr:hypothetical protein C823_004485 [Eubacterium plexicaudatum ASF492]
MGSFVTCRRRLSVSRRSATPGLHTPVPGMSSKAVMPPDNTAQIFKKGIKEEPAPVTFPHRMGAQNRPRGLLLSCGMQDFTPPGKPAAQRVSSGRRKTNKAAVAERGDKNAGKH